MHWSNLSKKTELTILKREDTNAYSKRVLIRIQRVTVESHIHFTLLELSFVSCKQL